MTPSRRAGLWIRPPVRAFGRLSDRFSLTPAGAGVFSLLFPGLLVAVLIRHRLLVAISVGAGLVLLANIGLAVLALRSLTATLRGPGLVTVGDHAELTVSIAGGGAGLACSVRVANASDWTPALSPVTGTVRIDFPRRSIVEELSVAVRTSVPFGLVEAARILVVPLAAPIAVAPAPIATPVALPSSGDPSRRVAGSGDDAGLRRYQPGDLKRDVHWPSVARTGELLVRDRQQPHNPAVATLLVSPSSPGGIETAIARARSAGDQLLAAGHRITLAGASPSMPSGHSAVVTSGYELAGRLAALEPAQVTEGDSGHGRGPTLQVGEEGARWRPEG
jgi:uncharacterized protein (DUF58 family)